jgi:hypothetical protein
MPDLQATSGTFAPISSYSVRNIPFVTITISTGSHFAMRRRTTV